jgi:hypothetical protein
MVLTGRKSGMFRRDDVARLAREYLAECVAVARAEAMKPSGVAGRLGMTLSRPVMAWLFQRFLHNLRRYTDERYASSDPVSTDPTTPNA